MNNSHRSVLIIGAGLGGLGLAQGLARAGNSATVFERDPSPRSRVQGYRITMRNLGMRALTELLPPERLHRLHTARIASVGDGITFADMQMRTLRRIPTGEDAAVQMLRSELRTVLQEGVDVAWNKQLAHIELQGDHVTAHFGDGSSARGDLLVGCDGVNSMVRQLMPTFSSADIPRVVATGGTVYTAQVERTGAWEELLPLCKDGMAIFLGTGSISMGVCFSERADRSPTIFWGITENQAEAEPGDILQHCRELLAKESCHPVLQQLVAATREVLFPWKLRTTEFPAVPHFPMVPAGRVTLLGDAAHAMPPGQGLGGSNVLEDARLLSTLLTAAPAEWPRCIAQYEQEMFARVRSAVAESGRTHKL